MKRSKDLFFFYNLKKLFKNILHLFAYEGFYGKINVRNFNKGGLNYAKFGHFICATIKIIGFCSLKKTNDRKDIKWKILKKLNGICWRLWHSPLFGDLVTL